MHLRLCFVFCLAAQLGWAFDAAVVGQWKSEDNKEVTLMEIRADGSAVVDGDRFTLQADSGRMKFIYAAGISVDAGYTLNGSTLVISMLGEKQMWQRIGAPPTAVAQVASAPPSPLAAASGARTSAPPANPLAAARAIHPAAGTWTDGQLTIVFRDEGNQLTGELVLAGQKFPTAAPKSGAAFQGTFDSNGTRYMYAAKVSGDTMEFQSDGKTFKLQRQAAAPAPAAGGNPLAAASAPATTAIPVANAPAGGNWLRRPDEGFDVLLPGDFRVLRQQGGGILLGSNVTPGIIIVFPTPAGTPADLERLKTQGVQDGGIRMSPQGAVRDVPVEGSTGKVMEVAGTLDQTRAQGLVGGYLRAEGTGGLAILAATTPESWPALKPFAEQAVRGVRLFKPMVSDRLLKARQALSGHSLVTSFNSSTTSQNSSGYYTGTATNSFRAWHCCSSGRGRYEGARSSSFTGGGLYGASDSGQGAQDGNWDLQAQGNDFLLTFRFDRGGSASWTVTVDANENVFVDNTRVKVTTDSICNQL